MDYQLHNILPPDDMHTDLEIFTLLRSDNEAEYDVAVKAFNEFEFTSADFPFVKQMILDPNAKVRFWSLDLLTNKLASFLENEDDELFDLVFHALSDQDEMVVDRASAIFVKAGRYGLAYLLSKYDESHHLQKKMILRICASNNSIIDLANIIIKLLLDNLSHPAYDMRFTAVHSLMLISPLNKNKVYKLHNINFELIYPQLIITLNEMIQSDDESTVHWGNIYLNRILSQEE